MRFLADEDFNNDILRCLPLHPDGIPLPRQKYA
jgi:hypothetical protein